MGFESHKIAMSHIAFHCYFQRLRGYILAISRFPFFQKRIFYFLGIWRNKYSSVPNKRVEWNKRVGTK